MTLCGAARQRTVVALQSARDRLVSRDDPALHETTDERFGVVERWIFPARAVEPEAPTDIRRLLVLPIDQCSRRMLRQIGSQREADAEPLAIGGAVGLGRPGFRSGQWEEDLTADAGDDHLEMTRGYGHERAGALAVAAPDALDVRRIRLPIFEDEKHRRPLFGALTFRQRPMPRRRAVIAFVARAGGYRRSLPGSPQSDTRPAPSGPSSSRSARRRRTAWCRRRSPRPASRPVPGRSIARVVERPRTGRHTWPRCRARRQS